MYGRTHDPVMTGKPLQAIWDASVHYTPRKPVVVSHWQDRNAWYVFGPGLDERGELYYTWDEAIEAVGREYGL